ncbi:MAG: polysaccharide deacetylase, partial [Mesorhizobium sp.]
MGLLRNSLCVLALSLLAASAGNAATLLEPTLHLKTQAPEGRGRVALTLDACGGKTDTRILSALVDNRIPATIFVTGIWLKRNAAAAMVFQLEQIR